MNTWVFAHGSLMAAPPFPVRRSIVASVDGWHRTFGHPSIRNWGTVDAPAPTSALMPGGSVTGVAHLVDQSVIDQIRAREDSSPVEVATLIEGQSHPALTWIMTGRWSNRSVARLATLAHANVSAGGGPLGHARDYLDRVRSALAAHDVADAITDRYFDAYQRITAR